MTLTVDLARALPRSTEAIGIPIATTGPVPRNVGLSRAALAANGFEGKAGQTLVIPSTDGPTVIVVGIGERAALDAGGLRDAAAALARAAAKRSSLATALADVDGVEPRAAAQAVVEGFVLAGYRYLELKADKSAASRLQRVTLVAGARKAAAVGAGIERGLAIAGAACLARDLANTPPAHLTAVKLAERAVEVATAAGLGVEVIDEHRARELGLGGLLGVNAGSAEPPRAVKLTYAPGAARGHLALVGKGVVYDSGGISLKPSNPMHALMKMDMSGAAAVLAAMSVLPSIGVEARVTGWMMCTDNMPSGSAYKLGDVLTFRNGKTAEIHNTDAEGRLILADGLSLAVEDSPDAIVDIATLTGSALNALGPKIAAVLGSDQGWVDQVRAAAGRTGEKVWQLPLAEEYRKMLDSDIADVKNVGGAYAGAITAALFLHEFTGDRPWAHLDIAGTMSSEADEGWLSRGATGFGTRLLIDLAENFAPPAH